MHQNPYKETIQDESSGVEVPNDRYHDWEAGYLACLHDFTYLANRIGQLCNGMLEWRKASNLEGKEV